MNLNLFKKAEASMLAQEDVGLRTVQTRVYDRGDHWQEVKSGRIFAKIGSPRILVTLPSYPGARPRRVEYVKLSAERAASYDPPKGSTSVTLGDSTGIKGVDFIEVQVTPELHNALGVEKAARALAAAQEIPWSTRIAYMGLGAAAFYLITQVIGGISAHYAAH